jgi:hypothetical protein
MRAFLPALVCLGLSGCGIPGGAVMWVQTKRYSGDGVIRNCSNLLGSGYAIQFPTFDASRPFAASYRVSHVPQLHRIDGRNDPTVYLRFYSNIGYTKSLQIQKGVTARFQVILMNSRGQVMHSVEVPLSTSGWSSTQNLYAVSKGAFHFDPDASYLLNVSYEPGAVPPPAKELYFEIDNCAYY